MMRETARVDGGMFRRALGRVRIGRVVQVIAALCLAVGSGGLLAYFATPRDSVMLGFTAFSAYLMAGAPLAVLLFLLSRQWALGVLALVVTVVAISTQWRLYIAAPGYRDRVVVVVMTSNLKLGEANAASVVAAVRRHHVDVLMLEELTPTEQTLLDQDGLASLLPHHVSDPARGPAGTGLWSRYQLTQTSTRTDFLFAFVTARAQIPGVSGEPLVAAAHMPGPWPSAARWQHDIAHLPSVLRSMDPSVPARPSSRSTMS
jgi:hypothetical protein